MIQSQGDWYLQYVLDLRSFVVIKLPEDGSLGAETCRSWQITYIVFYDLRFIVGVLEL